MSYLFDSFFNLNRILRFVLDPTGCLSPQLCDASVFPVHFLCKIEETSLPRLLCALEFAAVALIRIGVWFPGMCKGSLLFPLPQCFRPALGLTQALADTYPWYLMEQDRENAATQTKIMKQVSIERHFCYTQGVMPFFFFFPLSSS